MKTINWNVNSVKAKLPELQILIAQHSPDVLLLQETKLKPAQAFSLKNYNIHRKDFDGNFARGGVLIAVHNKIITKPLVLQTNLQACAVAVNLPTKLTLCSIYIHQDDDLSGMVLHNLVQQLPKPYLLCGDFNAHNIIWGSSNTNTRGKNIENFIDQQNLILHNTGKPTHFNVYNGNTSAIDLVLSTNSIAHLVDWDTLEQLYGSDHYPIITNISIPNHNQQINKYPTWRMKNADWEKYKASIDIKLPDTDTDVNTLNTIVTDAIIQAAEKAIPKNSTRTSRKQTIWWNKNCEEAVKIKNRLLSKAKRHPTEENLKNFKTARSKCRRKIREAKTNSWRQFTSTINAFTPISQVWAKIKMISQRNVFTTVTAIDIDRKIIVEKTKIANTLAKHFGQMSSNDIYNQQFQTIKKAAEENSFTSTPNNAEKYNDVFSKSEFKAAIKSMAPRAPGPDMIHIDMIKNLPNTESDKILEFYNLIWTKNVLPNAWKTAHVIPLLKPGKKSSEVNSYRPISLTNVLCKLLEKMVNNRLRSVLEERKLLDPLQFGFRSQRSTIDLLVKLQQDICDGFVHGQQTVLVSFDFEKAFDRLWRYKILQQLAEWNIEGNMFKFIKEFITNRTFQVRIQDVLSSIINQENGTPQGAVISPTLYILGITNLTKIIKPPVKYVLFADDLNIYVTTSNTQAAQQVLQQTIDNIVQWATDQGLTFSKEKTTGITFSHTKKPPRRIELNLGNSPIKETRTIKLLGMTFDQKMTWKAHVEDLKIRCQKALNVIKMVAHRNWGADRKHLKLLYGSLIRSKIDYGAVLYDSAKKLELQKLNTVQNSAIRLITGVMYTSPIPSMHVESNVLPLNLRRITLCLKYFTNLTYRQQLPTYRGTCIPKYEDIYARQTNKPKPVGIRCIFYSESLHYNLNSKQNIQSTDAMSKTHKREIKIKIKEIQTLIVNQWQNEWNEKHSNNKLYEIKPNIEEWKSSYRPSRKEETMLARIRIGHCMLTHSHLMDRTPPPHCDQCYMPLTIKHLLLDCSKYTQHRNSILGPNIELRNLLCDEGDIQKLFTYLQICNVDNI